MLVLPTSSSSLIDIIGLDPGTTMLGFADITFDLEKWCIIRTEARTLNGAKLMGKDSWAAEIHGERSARIAALRRELVDIFLFYQPLCIASESPFFNRLCPSAYGPLVEVISAIREAVTEYDVWKELQFVEPSTAKKAVGVVGRVVGKEAKVVMRNSVLALPDLAYHGEVPITLLDEHSIDAIAIAYHSLNKIRGVH